MKLVYLSVGLMVMFYTVQKKVTFHAVFHHKNHTKIFQFISSIDKFQILNPTIIDITHWERVNGTNFNVEYTEYLSQIPLIVNYAKAYYQIHKHEDGTLDMSSQHLTCFYTDLLCLRTESTLQITQLSKQQVGYEEQITYSCPWILSKFCFDEIAAQRTLIISKLTETFSTSPEIILKTDLNYFNN